MKTKTTPVPLSDITLRDFFAVFALQGLMSMDRASDYVDDQTGQDASDGAGILFVHTKFLSKESYMIADAMLEARK
jgi:hypothetical protein